MYNDIPPSASSLEEGCGKLGIQNLKQGIVTPRHSCSTSRA